MCLNKLLRVFSWMLRRRRSDVGAVGVRWGRGREHVRGAVVAQGGGALRVSSQILVVGVEAQPLASVAHVCGSGAAGVRGAAGAVVAVVVGGAQLQLIQRDGADGRAVHGEGVAGVAREVSERVCWQAGARVYLRSILLTAVILQTEATVSADATTQDANGVLSQVI